MARSFARNLQEVRCEFHPYGEMRTCCDTPSGVFFYPHFSMDADSTFNKEENMENEKSVASRKLEAWVSYFLLVWDGPKTGDVIVQSNYRFIHPPALSLSSWIELFEKSGENFG